MTLKFKQGHRLSFAEFTRVHLSSLHKKPTVIAMSEDA